MSMKHIIVWLSLWYILCFNVNGESVTSLAPLSTSPPELYCPPSCECGEGSELPFILKPFGAKIRHIYCTWTNEQVVNFTEQITMATESQSISFDVRTKCYEDTEILWTSSDFLDKTFAFRMYNCSIRNDGPVSFPSDSTTRLFILDTMRPVDVDKFQFQGFQQASIFQISYSNLTRVPNLHNMPLLTVLNLEGNNIEKIPCDVFYKKICKICLIDFNFNSISSIPKCPQHPSTLFGVPTYFISHNKLNDIEHIGDLDMTRVDLSYNQITLLPSFTKINLFNLTVSHNYIKEIKRSSFPTTTMLRYLDLSFNEIESIETASFSNILNLKELSLQGNRLIMFDERHTPPISLTIIVINLQYNQLQYPPYQDGRLPEREMVSMKSAYNPFICDCKLGELLNTTLPSKIFIDKELLTCQAPIRLQNESIVTLDLESSCPVVVSCPESCVCDYNKSEGITGIECSQRSLSILPLYLPEGKLSLNLSYNKIERVDTRDYFSSIVDLDLSWNEISNISSTGITLLSNVHYLYLNNNNMTTLPRSIIDVSFSTQTTIYLASNPWHCSCDLLWFPQWLRDSHSLITDRHQLLCHSPSSQLVMDVNSDILDCETNVNSNLSYIISSVLLLVLILVIIVIICKFRYEVKVLLYTRLHVTYFAPPKLNDEFKIEKDFDVFIVYSDEELKWTKENLLNRLENIEKPPFKTIVNDRDFLAGEPIDKNVTNAIENSYCSMFIFSEQFLKNEWCLYSFHCAYEHMLKEKDMKIVIILKEKIDIENLDEDLKAYFKSHTYLEFSNKIFWDKLLYVLPQKETIEKSLPECIV